MNDVALENQIRPGRSKNKAFTRRQFRKNLLAARAVLEEQVKSEKAGRKWLTSLDRPYAD